MRQPRFWFTPPNQPALRARVLAPISALAARATAARLRKGDGYRAAVPVICIGNINVGGTGKTPTVMALTEAFKAAGETPVIVTRGYGGALEGPVQVDPALHSAKDVGDEALMLSAFAPVIKATDRAQGAAIAETMGSLILLDDGHQNPSVIKDLTVIIANAKRGFGNGRVMPAGPLREPVQTGLARADAILTIGPPEDQSLFDSRWPTTLPHLRAELRPLATGMPWSSLSVIAFAGIGHPEAFFDTLRRVGANVVKSEALNDHQPLTSALMKRLKDEAKAHNAQLVTTEKDATRLPDAFRADVLPFPVRLDIESLDPLRDAIAAKGLKIKL